MIAKVVPAVRLPAKASETYDYKVPEALSAAVVPGAVVVVPFAGRNTAALVIAVGEQAETGRALKEIYGFAQGLSPLPGYVIGLWKRMAELFATTFPRFVWTALPVVPARFIETRSSAPPFEAAAKADGIFGRHAFHVNGPGDALALVRRALSEVGDRQALIICPTVEESEAWAKAAPGAAVYHSKLPTGRKYGIACALLNSSLRVAVGTKSAVFLPWQNLGAIFIVSAGSPGHMQEDSDPRFDARLVAEALAEAAGARVWALDPLIPLGLMNRSAPGGWKEENQPRPGKVSVHDLRAAARVGKGRVLLCEPAVNALDAAIDRGGRALVLLNRRGVSSSYVCRACGSAVNCLFCSIPLTVHNDRQSCPACERLFPLPETCAKCGTSEFKPVGFGSKTIAAALHKRYPASKIIHIDRDADRARPDDAQIVVGTSAVLRSLGPEHRPFEIVIDALLGAGSSRSGIWSVEENARVLRSLSAALSPAGELHVQSFDADSPALKAVTDPVAFAESEIAERKEFGYPPAKPLMTIHGALDGERETWEAALAVASMLKEKMPSAEVSGPEWAQPKIFRGKYRVKITAKVPAPGSYIGLAQSLPAGFAAEVRLF